jgi:hypothetical protein
VELIPILQEVQQKFGYLPRVAFNLDWLFKKAGAHGKQAMTTMMAARPRRCRFFSRRRWGPNRLPLSQGVFIGSCAGGPKEHQLT